MTSHYDFYFKENVPEGIFDYRPPDYYEHQQNPFYTGPYINWLERFYDDQDITHTMISLLTFFIPLHGYTWASNEAISKYMKISVRHVRTIISTLRQKNIIFSVGVRYDLVVLRRLMLYTEENYETVKYL